MENHQSIAITQLVMDLQVLKFAITQYIKK